MIEQVGRFLLVLSEALLLPDVVLLVLAGALSILHFGGLCGEVLRRRRIVPPHRRLCTELAADQDRRLPLSGIRQASPLAAALLPEAGDHHDRDKILDDLRLAMEARLERHNLLVRLGPMLGLAGTLIPLGPGLAALSAGDVAQLSRHLVVAFTTTVLGLLIGGLSFTSLSFRRRWYAQDLSDLEFLLSREERP
ncbi:MAG: MotA/TolQ/ExbB proton channel family protein [Planctomycetota bacterium]|nr:MAG: MotA/TolQ/ExbB proton channel family protein [Planctomycetota bacterium]